MSLDPSLPSVQERLHAAPIIVRINNDIGHLQDENSNLESFGADLASFIQSHKIQIVAMQKDLKDFEQQHGQITNTINVNNRCIANLNRFKTEQCFKLATNTPPDTYNVAMFRENGEIVSEEKQQEQKEQSVPFVLTHKSYLSTLPYGNNSCKIVENIPNKVISKWSWCFAQNKKKTTFPRLSDNQNIRVRAIYVNENYDLLVQMIGNGHVIFGNVKDIRNVAHINVQCCTQADIVAINIRVNEELIGDITWEETSAYAGRSQFVMKNLRRNNLEDVLIEWKDCDLHHLNAICASNQILNISSE